jgi:flagellar protein FlaG
MNIPQVGQNLAMPRVDVALEPAKNDKATQNVAIDSQQQVKDLFMSAETNKQEIDKQEVNTQSVVGVSTEYIEAAALKLAEILQTNERQLSFSVDEDSNKQVVKVTDVVTGEVIRQIPSEEVLKLSERLQDLQLDEATVVGLLFNKQV